MNCVYFTLVFVPFNHPIPVVNCKPDHTAFINLWRLVVLIFIEHIQVLASSGQVSNSTVAPRIHFYFLFSLLFCDQPKIDVEMTAFNYFETELLSGCFGDRLDGQYPTQIGFGLLFFGDSIVLEDKLFVLQRLPHYEVVLLGMILSLVLNMVDQTGDVAVFALQERVFILLFDFSQTMLDHLPIVLAFLQLNQHFLIQWFRQLTASSHYLHLILDVSRISLFAALFDVLHFLNNNLAFLAQTVFTLDVLKYLHGCLQAGELLKSQVIELVEEVFQL